MSRENAKTNQKDRIRQAASRDKLQRFESITEANALTILRILAERNKNVAIEIDAIAKELLSGSDFDEIAAQVQMTCEMLQVEDVWDRAGPKRDGYVDTGEAAWTMLEEALQPFRDMVSDCKHRALLEEADLNCQGILKGIYDFDQESSTQYKDWAVDAPRAYFGIILKDWKQLFGRRVPYTRMEIFLTTHCSAWSTSAMISLRPQKA